MTQVLTTVVNPEFPPQVEEGITLNSFTLEFTQYIQFCFDQLEAGQEHHILADPFYARTQGRPPLTDEEVDRVITALDAEYVFELGTYPGYHRNRSGANALPEFARMGPAARRAMVEGIDRIISWYAERANGTITETSEAR